MIVGQLFTDGKALTIKNNPEKIWFYKGAPKAGPTEEKWRNIGAAQTLYSKRPPPHLYAWIYSPLGRYGFNVKQEKVKQKIEPTHYFTHRYYICNLETGSWTEYKSNTGLFKVRHYWGYPNQPDPCPARSYRWNVNKIHGEDISNSSAVDCKGAAYIAITGDSYDQLDWIRCRLLPFNPLSLKPPLELVIRIDAIRNTLENGRVCHKLQPFCHDSRLLFRLSDKFDFVEPFTLPNEFFTIDLNKVQLDRNGVARIGMPEESLGLLKLPAPNFDPSNKNDQFEWNSDEYIINSYQFKGDESSKDASDSKTKECEVFITNLRESSIVKMSFATKWGDKWNIHPSGALLHWRQSDGLLKCLNRPRPLVRPPSLFKLSKQRLLMTDSHKPEDKFINGLLFD